MSLASKGPKKMKSKYSWRQRIELLHSLGEGTYGKVKLAVDKKTGQKMAVKHIMKKKIGSEQDLQRVRREIDIMASLSHEHIVQIYEVFENKEKFVIMMEYVDGGELYEYVSARGVLNDADARRVFRQVVAAVYYMHQAGVVHRDLKLENILLDSNGNVKLADFGLSNRWQHNRFLHTFCGSPLYASPEIVNGRPYYGPEVDCWSLGVLLYTLVYGTMPFDGSNFERLRSQITRGDYYEPTKPSDAASLIRRLLTVNAAKRATVGDVCRHWWTNVDYARSLWHEVQEVKVSSQAEKRTSDYFEDDSIFAESDSPCGAEKTKELQQLHAVPRLLTPAERPPHVDDQRVGGAGSCGPSDLGPVSRAEAAAAAVVSTIALPKDLATKCSSGDSGCALADLSGGCGAAELVATLSTERLTACDGNSACGKAAASRYSMSDIEAALDAMEGLLAVDRGCSSSSSPADHSAAVHSTASGGAAAAGDGGLADVVVGRRRSISVLPCSAPALGRDASPAAFTFGLPSAAGSDGVATPAVVCSAVPAAAAGSQWVVPARGRSTSLKSAKLYRCGDVKRCGGGDGSGSMSSLSSVGNLLDFDSSDSLSEDAAASDNVFPGGVDGDQCPDVSH